MVGWDDGVKAKIIPAFICKQEAFRQKWIKGKEELKRLESQNTACSIAALLAPE